MAGTGKVEAAASEDAPAPSRPSRGGRRPAGPDASAMGLPHFLRARHFVRGANVFIVPVWDLPSRWCPDEVKRIASAAAASSATPAVSSGDLGDGGPGDQAVAGDVSGADEQVQRTGDDEDSGSDSDQSDVAWDGALGSETRVWSRAAVEGALLLIRRVQAAAPAIASGGDEVAAAHQVYGIGLSAALFKPEAVSDGSDALLDLRLADVLKDRAPKWAVCALRSGHFAGAIFHGTEAVIHKAIHRYTVRKGQGGSQASQDNSGKKAKSAGSTLRRYGQQRLGEEIEELMTDKWKVELSACDIIFVSVSKRMRSTLIGNESKPFVPFAKVRRLPFMVGKPTFEAIIEAHARVAGVVFADESTTAILEQTFRKAAPVAVPAEAAPFAPPAREAAAPKDVPQAPKYCEEDDELYGPLHVAAAANDEDQIFKLLDEGADPTARDSKGRVAYFLCGTQRAREAFRRWRGLHEDAFDWHSASVPEGINEDSEQRKKDKEKEKKKKQKDKQKAQKANATFEQEEARRKEEEERKALEAAQTKCDNCKAPIISKPFSRLTYFYCTTDCVSAHRRELQAEAAMKRFS